MPDITSLSDDELRAAALSHMSDADLRALQSPAVTPVGIPTTDPYARDLQVAHPMAQTMSNIPAGENILPAPTKQSTMADTSSFEKTDGQNWTRVPTFVKYAKQVFDGGMEGSLTFASNLLSQIPGMQKPVQDANQYWANIRKDDEKQGFKTTAMDVGKGAAELNQANLLLKNPMNLVANVSNGVRAALPILSRTGQYATQALGNTALFAGLSSQQYDPNKPGQLFNKEAAANTMTDPSMYALNAAGTLGANWMKNARALSEAQAVDPNAMMRNLNHNPAAENLYGNPGSDALGGNTARKIKDLFFGITPALTEMGKQTRQSEGMRNAINGMVQDLSGQPPTPVIGAIDKFISGMAGSKPAQAVAANADKLTQWSSNIVQSTMKKMDRTENRLWNQGFKDTPISTELTLNAPTFGITSVQAVKDNIIKAQDLLTTNEFPGYKGINNSLDTVLRDNPTMNVNAVKQLNTVLSQASLNAREISGGIGNTLANNLKAIRDDNMTHIQNSLSPADMQAFNAASQYSAHKFELFDNASKLKSAVEDSAASHKLITSLISESGDIPTKQAVMNTLSPGGQKMVAATKIRQALEKASPTGRVNLDSFLGATGPDSQTATILPPAAQKQLSGLQVYLKNVDDSQKVGWWRQGVIGGTLAATAGLGAYENQDKFQGVAVPLVAYSALSMIANHSPLKSIFNAMTKDLPKNTFNELSKAATNHLTRAGYVVSNHGVLTHKNDIRPTDDPATQEQQ